MARGQPIHERGPRKGMRARHGAVVLLVLWLGVGLLGGCDVKTDVTLSPTTNTDLQERVTQLEADLARETARADRLQASLDAGGSTSVVRAGEEKFAFHINTSAAVVLVFTVLAIAAVLIARIRYGAEPRI